MDQHHASFLNDKQVGPGNDPFTEQRMDMAFAGSRDKKNDTEHKDSQAAPAPPQP